MSNRYKESVKWFNSEENFWFIITLNQKDKHATSVGTL